MKKLSFERFDEDEEEFRKTRCSICGLRNEVCLCSKIVPIAQTKSRFVLVLNSQEKKKASNTGVFAHLCIPNSEVKIRGERDKPLDMESLIHPDYDTFLLYPKDGVSVELTPNLTKELSKPVCLIVPDGNWNQARKSAKKILSHYPQMKCCFLKSPEPTQYMLRNETNEIGLATFEAVARAFGILEGKAVQEHLESQFKMYVQTQLGMGTRFHLLPEEMQKEKKKEKEDERKRRRKEKIEARNKDGDD